MILVGCLLLFYCLFQVFLKNFTVSLRTCSFRIEIASHKSEVRISSQFIHRIINQMMRCVVFESIFRQQMNMRYVILLVCVLYFPLVDSVLMASKLCFVVFIDLLNAVT